jgi:hypothetical protein
VGSKIEKMSKRDKITFEKSPTHQNQQRLADAKGVPGARQRPVVS